MKTVFTFLAMTACAVWSILAQATNGIATTVTTTVVTAPLPPMDGNLLTAMMTTIVHNPASLMVIGVLCVFAWLADDLPFVNSRYVAHYTVIAGASIYWLFAFPASVPVNFPHPSAVFASNGIICGLIAFGIHKQAVARVLEWARGRNGTEFLYKADKQNSQPNPTDKTP